MNQIPEVVLVALSVAVFVGGTVWALAWWLSGQFSEIRSVVYQQIARVEGTILDKLEYHEKHDDTRFSNIDTRLLNVRDDLWDMRVRNAAKDGLPPLMARDKDK
jgi:hypothetical protein